MVTHVICLLILNFILCYDCLKIVFYKHHYLSLIVVRIGHILMKFSDYVNVTYIGDKLFINFENTFF